MQKIVLPIRPCEKGQPPQKGMVIKIIKSNIELIQSLALNGLEDENQFNSENDYTYEWFNSTPELLRGS